MFGLFSDEGLIEGDFSTREEAKKGALDYDEDDELEVLEICRYHEDQPREFCEFCDECDF